MSVNARIEALRLPTPPARSYVLEAGLLDVTQLAEGRIRAYVNQGYAALAREGEALQSEGFSLCSALIVQRLDGPEALLAHIDDWDLSDRQHEVLGQLPPGRYCAAPVIGSLSRNIFPSLMDPEISDFMQRICANGREVKVLDTIKVQTGNSHWGVSYNPEDGIAKVLVRRDAMVREYEILR